MKPESKPLYFVYLAQTEQSEDLFFNQVWSVKFAELSADLAWIDELEVKDGEAYSRDFDHVNFPTYYNWPASWRKAYEAAQNESHTLKKNHLAQAEVHQIDTQVIYIIGEEVWLSTPHYDNSVIYKMKANEVKGHSFDSVVTAAYAYINDFNEWKQAHGKAYERANIASKAQKPFTDSLVGTMETCDQCGGYAVIAKEENGNAICFHCASASV